MTLSTIEVSNGSNSASFSVGLSGIYANFTSPLVITSTYDVSNMSSPESDSSSDDSSSTGALAAASSFILAARRASVSAFRRSFSSNFAFFSASNLSSVALSSVCVGFL